MTGGGGGVTQVFIGGLSRNLEELFDPLWYE